MSIKEMKREGLPRVTGVFRVSDNNRVLAVSFTVPPTDAELRQFHDHVRAWRAPIMPPKER